MMVKEERERKEKSRGKETLPWKTELVNQAATRGNSLFKQLTYERAGFES